MVQGGHICIACRLTLRLQFLRRWEACKGWLAPYASPPLVGCAAAWRAFWPIRASQQASDEPGHLAKSLAVSSQPHAPAICGIGNHPEASYDTFYSNGPARLDGEEGFQLPGMAQCPEGDPRPVQVLEGEWDADINEQCGMHEEGCSAEQTDFWTHSKVE